MNSCNLNIYLYQAETTKLAEEGNPWPTKKENGAKRRPGQQKGDGDY